MNSKVKKPIKAVCIPLPVLPPTDYTLARDGTTQTLLGDFMTCRRRWLLKLWKWSHPGKQRSKFFGSIIHKVLGDAYNAAKKTRKPYSEKQVWAAVKAFAPFKGMSITNDDLEEDRARAAGVLVAYMWYYGKEFTTPFAAEKVYDVPVGALRLRGRIDADMVKGGQPWLMETKSKARIEEESILTMLAIDLQLITYATLFEVATGKVPGGVVYNVLRKPELKKFANPAELYKRVLEDAKARPEHYFKRWEVALGRKAAPALVQFKKDLAEVAADMAACLAKPAKCYPNAKGCASPYKCDFIDACAAGSMQGYIQREHLFEELIDDVEA